MYMLNNFTDREAMEYNNPVKNTFYEKYKFLFLTLGIISSLVALVVSFELGSLPFVAVFASTLLGIFYSVKIIPRDIRLSRYWRLKDIPASKDVFIALAWATITVFVPFLSQESIGSFLATSVAFLFVFSLVYTRSLLFDIRDIQGDQSIGRETIPIIIGKEKTKLYLGVILIMTAVGLFVSGWFNWASSLSFLLLVSVGYCVFYLYLYHKRIISQGISCDAVVDGQFYLTGLITLFWMNSFAA
jgi:4-hydroxy-3-methylbut-2-enyl diphosphate reductase